MRLISAFFLAFLATVSLRAEWETLEGQGSPTARHEAGFVEHQGKLYLLGGRGIKPTDIYDPDTQTWTAAAKPPIEIHHFQPVSYGDAIWIVGAMTGPFPNETPLEKILKYLPSEDRWQWGPEIPADRRRGGAGVSIYEDVLYLSCGIVRGHMGGYVNWFDAFDLKTETWSQLPDAPHARDHFQSAITGDKLYLGGGRRTSHETKEVFSLVVPELDVFDFATQTWSTAQQPLPTPRAGNATTALHSMIIVAGGESGTQMLAHSEVEAYHTEDEQWYALPSLNRGRHGTGLALIGQKLFIASGCGNRGGSPELDTIEAIPTDSLQP